LTTSAPPQLFESIDHIVVLMLENRSFDHMLGFLYADSGNVSPTGDPFEGLTGNETNTDASGTSIAVSQIVASEDHVYFLPGADPGEGYTATNEQLYASADAPTPPVATMGGFVTNFATTLTQETKEGTWDIVAGTTAPDIMQMFTPATLPVLSGLARGYAVCDHWFASVPTETMPNRAFACAATSQGHMDDKTKSFTAPSIFGLLDSHDVAWSVFGYDAEPLTRLDFSDTKAAADSHFGTFPDFTAACAAGTLGAYTFLEPSWSSTGNSQHPNYDVALGEQLIHDVYEAVRTGPAWGSTLLVVTYDEHGGCYDHVAPPTNATPPDDTPGQDGFDFRRFGVRVPTVLVSPLIAAGTVFRVPDGSTALDHTSILRTVELRWGLPSLTARDAAAPDFTAVITLSEARTDDPLAGVTVPVSGVAGPDAIGISTIRPSHLEQVYARLTSELPVAGSPVPSHPPVDATSQELARYSAERIAAWKAARAAADAPPTV
jgi:phospholipase C